MSTIAFDKNDFISIFLNIAEKPCGDYKSKELSRFDFYSLCAVHLLYKKNLESYYGRYSHHFSEQELTEGQPDDLKDFYSTQKHYNYGDIKNLSQVVSMLDYNTDEELKDDEWHRYFAHVSRKILQKATDKMESLQKQLDYQVDTNRIGQLLTDMSLSQKSTAKAVKSFISIQLNLEPDYPLKVGKSATRFFYQLNRYNAKKQGFRLEGYLVENFINQVNFFINITEK